MNSRINDNEIIELIRSRDQSGLEFAYNKYGGALYSIIFNVTRSRGKSQEVLQDVFMKLWNQHEKYDSSKGRLYTWLANISRNAAIDATRSAAFSRKKQTKSLGDIVHTDRELSEDPPIRDTGIADVIDKMDEKHRVLCNLIYYKGYTHKEAQEELDIPLGTVKSRIRAAIKYLRKHLGKELGLE